MASIVANADTSRVSLIVGTGVNTSTSQYKCVYMGASMTANLCTAATDDVIGIIDSNQSASSDYVSVIYHGLAKGVMRTGTSCVIGALLVPDAGGTLDTAITATNDENIVGRALTVPATGGAVTVLVHPQVSPIRVP